MLCIIEKIVRMSTYYECPLYAYKQPNDRIVKSLKNQGFDKIAYFVLTFEKRKKTIYY